MIGAILGDMIGAPYEFDRGNKSKDFPLFCRYSQFTDDSVMTIAVAEALLDTPGLPDDEVKAALVKSMRKWGRRYPDAGYGVRFSRWLRARDSEPYGSYGNGSAMRVSAAGWLYDTLDRTRHAAVLTAEVTHNHPEGIKGAEATASAIYLARTGRSKEEIKAYITREFGYDLTRTCDEIRPDYRHVESCQKTVPEAITAFLEGTDFEDVIRTAVSLGGDCDTLTCIAGSIAEAFYGVPAELEAECRSRLPADMLDVLCGCLCGRLQPRRAVRVEPELLVIDLCKQLVHDGDVCCPNVPVFPALCEAVGGADLGHARDPCVSQQTHHHVQVIEALGEIPQRFRAPGLNTPAAVIRLDGNRF